MENPYKKNFDEKIVLCGRNLNKKGAVYEMHWHDYIEVEIVLHGEVEHICNDHVTDISRGHVYIITPHDFHAVYAKTDATLLNICFHAHILEKEVRETLEYIDGRYIYGFLDESGLKRAVHMFEQISDEQLHPDDISNAMAKAVLNQLLIDIIRLSGKQYPTGNHSLVSRAISYVQTHFRESISVVDLACAVSVSPNYMGRLFCEHTGMTFNSYLNELRLKYACNMLRFSALTTKEIAKMSGYSSVEYFFYVFKKELGITPNQYRVKNGAHR